jgi:hypothetical protein
VNRALQFAVHMFAVCSLAALTACGGGSTSPPPAPVTPVPVIPPPPLAITTASTLPATVQGLPYTTAMSAANGQGALHWSITSGAPSGLSIDANTGVISGTVNSTGWFNLSVKVSDSASPPQTAGAVFNLTAYAPLQAGTNQSTTTSAFQSFCCLSASATGGVDPKHFAVTGGSLPPGLQVNHTTGQITGGTNATGAYQATVTIQDSYSPPEAVTQSLTITVQQPALSSASSLPSTLLLNRPFSGNLIAQGEHRLIPLRSSLVIHCPPV